MEWSRKDYRHRQYNTLTKLLYVTAHVLWFIECIKSCVCKCTDQITTRSFPSSSQPTTNWQHWLCMPHMLTSCMEEYSHSIVTALWQRYWIPTACRVIGKLLKKCVICCVAGRPFSIPDPPLLPHARVREGPPFDVTGIDFTGAMYVRNEGSLSESKVYICLFTCANTRAVHLEVVTDLSEETFLQAFCRFAARRSLPRLIISDNASTYMSASKELDKLFQSPTLKAALMKKGTTWRFIPKRAPWYGAFGNGWLAWLRCPWRRSLVEP